MNYSVVHTACGKQLFVLGMRHPLMATDDVAALAMRQLDVDSQKTGQVEGEWPLVCASCGRDLTFFQARDGYRPMLRLSGNKIFHD
jgi:hypothetical protein